MHGGVALGLVAASVALSGCYLRHDGGGRPRPDAGDDDAAVRRDGGSEARDAGPVGGRDGEPPGSPCAELLERDGDRARLVFAGREANPHFVIDALTHDGHALFLFDAIDVTAPATCLASVGPDLQLAWSVEVVPGIAALSFLRTQLAVIGGQAQLVFLGVEVDRRAIDVERGALGPPIRSRGTGRHFEWARVAGAPRSGFVVAWNDAWETWTTAHDAAGALVAGPTTISTNGRYPTLVAHPSGDLAIGYHELRRGTVTGAIFQRRAPPPSPCSPSTSPPGTTSWRSGSVRTRGSATCNRSCCARRAASRASRFG